MQILQCGLIEGQRLRVQLLQRQRGRTGEGARREVQRGEVGVCASEERHGPTGDGQRLHRLEGGAVEGEGREGGQVCDSRTLATPTRQRQRLLLLEVRAMQLHRLQRRDYASPRLACPTRLQRQRAVLRHARAQRDLCELRVVAEEEIRLSEAVVLRGEGGQGGKVTYVEGLGLGEVVAA